MEEADLLKERLQAITDKRKIQEDIAKKRREIEEEKLKLQYIKKKALRDHWLLDGVSQQSEEEQEVLRLQAEDGQQQSDQLQSNILRIEKDIEALETQELSISANEEIILKRLKEVERTAEDIIKELNVGAPSVVTHHCSSPNTASFISVAAKTNNPSSELERNEEKKACFALEISVEHNKKTGKSEVVSTATITPETIQQKGLKVYEDGRKSVYALQPDGAEISGDAREKMTLAEVEELLCQAAEKKLPSEVQYHQAVYSLPYKGSCLPSTPGVAKKPHEQSQGLGSQLNASSFNDGGQQLRHKSLYSQRNEEMTNAPLSQRHTQPDSALKTKQRSFHQTAESDSNARSQPQSLSSPKSSPELLNSKPNTGRSHPVTPTPQKMISEEIPGPQRPVYRTVDNNSENEVYFKPSTERSDDLTEEENVLNLVNTLPDELESQPVTMVFMGYENAVGEEDEDIQAELVMISSSEDDDDEDDDLEAPELDQLSYHPEGYTSKVFTPKVCRANVVSSKDPNLEDSQLYTPTFMHRYKEDNIQLLREERVDPANIGRISLEKVKLSLSNDRALLPQSLGC